MLLTGDLDDVRADVAPALLERYPVLESLDEQKLHVSSDRLPRVELLVSHATAARERWRTLKQELALR